jgi:hypothetical protein
MRSNKEISERDRFIRQHCGLAPLRRKHEASGAVARSSGLVNRLAHLLGQLAETG